jgi:hypothetical protein
MKRINNASSRRIEKNMGTEIKTNEIFDQCETDVTSEPETRITIIDTARSKSVKRDNGK